MDSAVIVIARLLAMLVFAPRLSLSSSTSKDVLEALSLLAPGRGLRFFGIGASAPRLMERFVDAAIAGLAARARRGRDGA